MKNPPPQSSCRTVLEGGVRGGGPGTINDKVLPEWGVDFNKPWLPDRERNWETSAAMQHWKDLA